MATGDQSDVAGRLQQLVPAGWFPRGASPIRDALTQGIGQALAFAFSLLAYVRLQTRLLTATDGFLDLIAFDFLGPAFVRAAGQSDSSFRARILAAMFRERVTRAALVRVLTQVTGFAPIVVEPQRPADTGAYSAPNSGYGVAGAYGSVLLPMQLFVQAYRPSGSGIARVSGYGMPAAGYGVGPIEYASLSMVQGVADADIMAAVNSVRPAGTTVWVDLLPPPR